MKTISAAFLAVSALFAASVEAHTSLLEPLSREGGKEIIEDVQNRIGCGKGGIGKVTHVKAGANIPVRYYRNNHIGGFVRWSIIKRGQPETRENFDKNIFLYTCREVGKDCHPRNLPFSRWERANDNVDVFNIICGDYITIPKYLDDGDYVLQFTNFGTGHSNGIPGQATPTYRSCADLRVTGGSSKNARPKCPGFQGGDRVTYNENKPNNQCYYYKDNFVPNYLFQENDVGKLNGLYRLGRPKVVEDCNSRSLDLESYPAENYNATHDYSFDALN